MQDLLTSGELSTKMRFVSGTQLQWTEPDTIKDLVSNKYYVVRKESINPIHKLTKFLKPTSSKDLFKMDSELWRTLRDKKFKVDTNISNWENSQFVVTDDEVITIVSSEDDIAISQFLESLKDLDKNEYKVLFTYRDKRFEAIVYNKETIIGKEGSKEGRVNGILINLLVPKRDLKIWDVDITFDEDKEITRLLPAPRTIVKGNLDVDLFEKMGSIETLVENSDASSLVRYLEDDLKQSISVAELLNYLKKAGLAIKGKNIEKEISSKFDIERHHLESIIDSLEEASLDYSHLKSMYRVSQSSTLTIVTFNDILKMFSQIVSTIDETKLVIPDLPDLVDYATSGRVHKKQLEQTPILQS